MFNFLYKQTYMIEFTKGPHENSQLYRIDDPLSPGPLGL